MDDASTDDTAERVKRDKDIVPAFGICTSRMETSALKFDISHPHHQIVALMDGDDLFLPARKMAEAFQQDPGLGTIYHPLVEWNVRTGERRDRGY
jgi:glycosyltransferase involved in cell wall biosynthesis